MRGNRLVASVITAFCFVSAAVWSDLGSVRGQSGNRELVRATTIAESGGRLDWSHSRDLIAFDRAGEDQKYDIYTMRPDGSGVKCLTCNASALPGGHAGNPAWHPSGDFILFQAERVQAQAGNRGRFRMNEKQKQMLSRIASPGIGFHNDLWLMDASGKRYWKLSGTDPRHGGILHPHFSSDGRKLVWAERISGGQGGGSRAEEVTGQWTLKVADFVAGSNNPRLANVQAMSPEGKGLYESHGFSPDGRRLLFTISAGTGENQWGYDIADYNIATRRTRNLTDSPTVWDEHAHYTPSGRIFWMSSRDLRPPARQADIKTDYWIMDADGSNKRRLTHFNTTGYPEYQPGGVCAADSSIGPDGKRVVGYLIIDGRTQRGKIVMMDFANGL
jgi:Tol biopolymer transport system component